VSSLIRLPLVRDEPPGDRDSAAGKTSFGTHLRLRERARPIFMMGKFEAKGRRS